MLKTNYKNDVFSGQRKYTMTENDDNTVSFADATTYSQIGDSFGASNLNETNDVVNLLSGTIELTQTLSTTSSTIFEFVNKAIHTDSSIHVLAKRQAGDVSGEENTFRYSDIYATEGRCTVTFPKFTTAIPLKVKINIMQKE